MPWATDLDGDVQHGHGHQGHGERARDGAGGAAQLPAGREGSFHAGECEDAEDEGAAEAVGGGMKRRQQPRGVHGGDAGDHEDRQRRKLQQRRRADQARAAHDAADIDQRDRADHGDDEQRAHGGTRQGRWQQACAHAGQRRGHPAAGEHVAEPQQRAGDVADQRAEGLGDIAVGAAAGGDAAAALGEAQCDRTHRQRAAEQRQRRIRSAGPRQHRRHRKDPRPHHDADDAERQTGDPDRPQHARVPGILPWGEIRGFRLHRGWH